jgi:DNA-binding response OmpR family regulator
MRMTGSPCLTGVRLLLVDDDDDLRHELASVFTLYGAMVDDCDSRDAALARLRRRRFDVVVSDLEMPNGDGCSLVSGIRQSTDASIREMRAAAVSVRDDFATRSRALDAGFDLFVSKLSSIGTLVQAVAQLTRASRTATG